LVLPPAVFADPASGAAPVVTLSTRALTALGPGDGRQIWLAAARGSALVTTTGDLVPEEIVRVDVTNGRRTTLFSLPYLHLCGIAQVPGEDALIFDQCDPGDVYGPVDWFYFLQVYET
jgi:hypothetical protein